MNGVHDMGGMQDMGPVHHEKNEPVFHEPWEGRVYALNRAAGAWRKWNLDASRYEIELIPPAEYLRMSYYERWYARLIELLVKRGLVTRTEIETGKPAPDSPKATPAMTLANIIFRFRPSQSREKGSGDAGAFQGGRAGASTEHQSDRPHAIAALRTGKAGHHHPGPRNLHLSRYQRSFSGRETAACLLGSLRRTRTMGRTGIAARFCSSGYVGRLP